MHALPTRSTSPRIEPGLASIDSRGRLMSSCSGTFSVAELETRSDTPEALDVRWRREPGIASWTHSWSFALLLQGNIDPGFAQYQCHQALRLYALFYRLFCRVAMVLASKVAACSISSSLDHRPSVKRSAPSACSRVSPIANNTAEGSVLPS